MDASTKLDFTGKLILAPMVRISMLPMRLLALDYGADIVYCEEIIDFKMLQCKRIENALLGTTDFVWSDGTVVFRTCPRESDRLVFQIGTSDAGRALQVAKMVEDCVAGIDINMGCPKEFSIKGGMGAALMSQPEKIKQILTTLVSSVSRSVTCKTRIMPTLEETIGLIKLIVSTGVQAVAIHGRTKDERPTHPNHNDVISAIVNEVNIPVIANGGSSDLKCYEDILKFKHDTGASSVMVARAAQWNPSIFSKTGVVYRDEVIRQFIKYAVRYDSALPNMKYCMQQLLHDDLDSPLGKQLLSATSVRDICSLWGMDGYYDEISAEFEAKKQLLNSSANVPYCINKLSNGTSVFQMDFKYNRRDYTNGHSPKMTLHEWAIKNKLDLPKYETVCRSEDRMYQSFLNFQGQQYSANSWDKSKKFSEQAAAGVCILVLQMQENGEATMTPPEMPYNRTKELARDCKRLRLDNSNEQNREKTNLCVSGAGDQSSDRSNDRSNGDNVTKKTS